VRLVDRLAEAGLVTRGPGSDRRSRSIILTDAGRRAAERVAAARATMLSGALADLSAAERATLDNLLGRIMTNVVNAKDGGAWICRLCDLQACRRAEGHCPAATAARAKYNAASIMDDTSPRLAP
jgi:hypothetical protein